MTKGICSASTLRNQSFTKDWSVHLEHQQQAMVLAGQKAWFVHVVGRNGKRSSKKLAEKRKAAFEEYRQPLEAASAKVESERLSDPFFAGLADAKAWMQEVRSAGHKV